MKNIDNHTRSAVFVGQVASKPRVNGQDRTELRYFCAHSLKGLSGGQGNTIPVREIPWAVSVHGFEPPGTFESATFENERRYTMQTVNVVDAISDCAYVLSFLDAAFTFPQRQQITLTYEAHCGLSLILADLSQRLSASADALSGNQTTLEV